MEQLKSNFKNVKVFILLRNIIDVAQSYKRRLLNDNDNWSRTTKTCIEEWNSSLRAMKKYESDPNVFIVHYESLFGHQGNEVLTEIEHFMNFDLGKIVQTEYQKFMNYLPNIKEKRNWVLDEGDILNILSNADILTYRHLKSVSAQKR